MIARQDDLLYSSEDMEEVETFFKSQRAIFDAARQLERDLQNERDYFVTDADATEKIEEISSILEMAKPYARIKDLSDLMQGVKTATERCPEEGSPRHHHAVWAMSILGN